MKWDPIENGLKKYRKDSSIPGVYFFENGSVSPDSLKRAEDLLMQKSNCRDSIINTENTENKYIAIIGVNWGESVMNVDVTMGDEGSTINITPLEGIENHPEVAKRYMESLAEAFK